MSKKIKQCVFCGEKKIVTRDHVISRGLFPEKYEKTNLIIVPSCEDCNNGFSNDEEYFRLFLNNFSMEHSKESEEIFNTKIKRSIERRPQIGHKVKDKMELVDYFTKNGIYLGKKTKVNISDNDWDRYHNVLDKYIKGLFYHEFKIPMPADYKIKHVLGDKDEYLQKITKEVNNWNLDNKEVFAYAHNSLLHSYDSIWITVYYNTIVFISFALTKEKYNEMDEINK